MQAIFLIIGILVGAAVGWLWANWRGAGRLQAERERLGAAQAEAETRAQAEREQRVAAETRLQEVGKQLTDRDTLIAAAKQQLADTFRALSSDALRDNSQAFVERAEQSLEPVRETLRRYEDQIRSLEGLNREVYGNISRQVTSLLTSEQQLQRETVNLVNALRRPHVRGKWGELTLHRAVELAGMSEHVDYLEQVTSSADSGRIRPDMVVTLPNGRQVLVDVKTPLDAYLTALEASSEEERKACLLRHCQQIRQHMNALAGKSYWEGFRSAADFVVMFIPGESFLCEAAASDPALLDDGAQKNVILATPTTFIALLRAINLGWREERLAKNAEKISEAGRQLYDGVRTFTDHLLEVGQRLDTAAKSYNKAIASLMSRVLPRARRLRELDAGTGADLPEPALIETQVRYLERPEEPEEPAQGP